MVDFTWIEKSVEESVDLPFDQWPSQRHFDRIITRFRRIESWLWNGSQRALSYRDILGHPSQEWDLRAVCVAREQHLYRLPLIDSP